MNLDMKESVYRFYSEGFNTTVNTFNPYSGKGKMKEHCAWEAGFVDAHGESSKKQVWH